jgi:hypothetical protein
VNKPVPMRRVQRRGHLGDHVAGQCGPQGAVGIEQFAHVAAWHVAHRDEQDTVGLTRLEDGDDVRVVNGGRGPGLTDEALPERVVEREPGCEDLQSDVAVQADVESTVDDGHPAPASMRFSPADRPRSLSLRHRSLTTSATLFTSPEASFSRLAL